MKIIYHCYGGTHSSVTAAFIHLGLLPADCVPGQETFKKMPFFDRQEADEHGHIFFAGVDEVGNEVYLTAQRGRPEILKNIFHGLAEIFNIPPEEYLLINVMHEVNLAMKFGGYLSRRLRLIKLGRPIVILGTRAAYFRLVDLVEKVKHGLGKCGNDNPVLQQQQVSPGRPGRGDSYRSTVRVEEARWQRIVEPSVFEFKK